LQANDPPSRYRHYFKREALYELVWTAPVLEVAKRLGVSDVGLAKLCRRAAIPKQLATTPTEIVRNDVVHWRVSTRPATLLDLLRHQTVVGGLETVARVTRDLSSAIDRGELVTALDALDQAPAGQRLGFVFQCLGYDTLANHVFKWVARRRHAVRQPLELGVPTREQTTIDRRWNISFNSRRVTALEEFR